MPFSLDVTKEVFTSFRYNLKVHLLFLVTMAVVRAVYVVIRLFASCISSGTDLRWYY